MVRREELNSSYIGPVPLGINRFKLSGPNEKKGQGEVGGGN